MRRMVRAYVRFATGNRALYLCNTGACVSYSTQLAFTYPLGSVVILDLAYQGSGIYSSDGTEGAWYVAGWSGKSDLKLSRDRRRAYMGEWEIMSHVQTVIGSPEWWDFHGKSVNVNARISQVVGPIPIQIVNLKHKSHPDPYLTPLLTSVDHCLIDSLDQIPNDATPLHPLLILRKRIDQEDRERDQEIRAYESAIQAELEAYREHEAKSALAFRKLYDGKNEEGRMLTRKYSATMAYFRANRELFESLELANDATFRPLYDAMMDSITIPTKRASLRKVLDWLRWKKGIDIPVPIEGDSK